MFYEPAKRDHGLLRDPFNACVVPRPIGWISTVGNDGVVNLAPFSYFNAVSYMPHLVMFSSVGHGDRFKSDTLTNIDLNGEFVVNLVTYRLRDEMNKSSTELPYGVSETETFNIATAPSTLVKPPRVKEALIHLECKHVKSVDLNFDDQTSKYTIAIGHVVGIHIHDDLIHDGKVDISKAKVISRLGYNEYGVLDHIFPLDRPSA